MSKWIRKNDKVIVIAGNDKGKTGTVLSRKKNRVVIQGINLRKKHMKRTQQTQSAQIIDMEMPIDISNVAFCSNDDKKVKVKVKKDGSSIKLIYFDNSKEIVLRTIKEKSK